MKSSIDAIRKAAVLVSSLDADMADKLLDQMPGEMADRVRRAVADLDEIAPGEQDAIIREFVGRDEKASQPTAAEVDDGVELSAKLAREFALDAVPQAADRPPSLEAAAGVSGPFQVFRHLDVAQLAPWLVEESPQTVALVAAHLPPDRSSALLASLPAPLQSEVLRRLLDLDEAHPEIVMEVERGLTQRLSVHRRNADRRQARLACLTEVLRQASAEDRQNLLLNIRSQDPDLADRLGKMWRAAPPSPSPPETPNPQSLPPRKPAATRLDQLDDRTLSEALRTVDAEVARLALAGCESPLVDRVLRRLPPAEGRQFRRNLEVLGPIRLADIDAAKSAVLAAAQRFADLELPSRIAHPAAA